MHLAETSNLRTSLQHRSPDLFSDMPSTSSSRDCPTWSHPIWHPSSWEPTIYTSTAPTGIVQYRCNFPSADTDWGPYTTVHDDRSVAESFRNTFNEGELWAWEREAQHGPRADIHDEDSNAPTPNQTEDPPHVRVADNRIAYSLMSYPTICTLIRHFHLDPADYDRLIQATTVAGTDVNVRQTGEEIGIDHQHGAAVWAQGPHAPSAVRWLVDIDRVVELPPPPTDRASSRA